jgi:hypothetical protein
MFRKMNLNGDGIDQLTSLQIGDDNDNRKVLYMCSGCSMSEFRAEYFAGLTNLSRGIMQ